MSTLENLRREAKRWLKALRAEDPSARARLSAAHPKAPANPGLRDIQHALALEHGFENWKAFVDAVSQRAASPTLERFVRLARDLVVAYESGEPSAMQRLVDQFGGHATWERIRAGVDDQLRTLPQPEIPEGDFSVPHARLLIARLAGCRNWAELEGLLEPGGRTPAARRSAVPPPESSEIGPGMIQPGEMKAGLHMRLHDGVVATTTEVWSMLIACRNGDLARVKDLVSARPSLVRCDYNYMPPLHLAVREGHLDIVHYLAEHAAANPKYVTYPYNEPLLTVALDRGYDEIARVLQEHFARADPDRPGEESGEIQYEKDDERRRFERLVGMDALAEVEALLKKRPELALDEFAFWSEGILAMPANRGHRPMVELLLRYGACVPQVTKWGAWYYFKHYDLAAFLMQNGMSPHHMNCHHTTLLHDMAYTGDVRKAALLLDHGADIDAVDEEFRSTPLGVAARFGRREVVQLLLERSADPHKAAAPWAVPLEWARKKGHAEIASLLGAAGRRAVTHRAPGRDDTLIERVNTEINDAINRRDVAALERLIREHRAVVAEHRASYLEMDAGTIVARAHTERHLPVRPDIQVIGREVDARGGGDPARLAVARSYGADTWERLQLAIRLVDAIWRDDDEAVLEIVTKHPRLVHEDALIRSNSNWGPPMTYAANLGRNRIIRLLHGRGARDLQSALDRAVLQGQIDTARMLCEMGARPPRTAGTLGGPAETLNAHGMALLVELGVEITPANAPVAMVLQTYSRNSQGKHQILELFARHGVALPDTAPMAVHRGRVDLLEQHLRTDPRLFSRTFAHREFFPPALGCHEDETFALHGTPLGGAGLLHMCVEYGELEIARWMLERGADVNLKARIDAHGFGGHTPLFNCVVSMNGGRRRHGDFARLLLDQGADPHVRASLRKAVRFSEDESVHEYRDVTPLEWGERFHERGLVNEEAMAAIAGRLHDSS